MVKGITTISMTNEELYMRKLSPNGTRIIL